MIAARFDPRAELAGPHAVRFLRSLPRGARSTVWAVPAGAGGRDLRVSSSFAPGGVRQGAGRPAQSPADGGPRAGVVGRRATGG
ncbi:hypothetical protein [Nonomuraea basaltis]|uniref:hypothetical protein n=1 Tax=Nonomuraea basaltis TaxID=2495887 RepID=UPI001F10AEDF|nr:hypothetical protein [Nonomuraea basaltis]